MPPELIELIKAYGVPGFVVIMMVYTLQLNNKHLLKQRERLEEMEQQQSDRQAEIEGVRLALERRHAELQEEIRRDLTKQLDEALDRENKLRSDLYTVQRDYRAAKERLEEAQKALTSATEKLDATTLAYQNALKERDSLQGQIIALREELNTERKARQRVETELKGAMEELKKDTQTIVTIDDATLKGTTPNA